MAHYFETGKTISIRSGGKARIVEKLGEGGQGIVYKVNYDGNEYALKWYFVNKLKDPSRFYKNLENNIKTGSPASSFLWPKFLTEKQDDSFGYLMDLRPGEYKDFGDFLLAKVHFKSLNAVVNAAINIVNAFRELHRKGLSYQDLNDGNFFINPETGDVLICDNDNVAPDLENLGIGGKSRYMAPEVVVGEKAPDSHTDRFSLSVVLFMMLFLSHPLEGENTMVELMSESSERQYYGETPMFIYDESGINRPVHGVHKNAIKLWPVYPKFIKEAFKIAFGQECMIGNKQKHRIIENEWQKLFVRLRDQIVSCPFCGGDTFFDTKGKEAFCINCSKKLPKTYVLKIHHSGLIDDYDVVLYPGTNLYQCHITDGNDDYKTAVGEIKLSTKSTPPKMGLKNISQRPWTVVLSDREILLEPMKTVVIGNGLKLRFSDKAEAEVVLI